MNHRRFFPRIIIVSFLILLGFSPQTSSTQKQKKGEQAQDTTWLTYVEPNEYSFQYPKTWELQIRWKQQIPGLANNLGFEILSLHKYTPHSRNKESCGLDGNSAKVILCIQMKDSNSLEEIANKPDIVEYDYIRFKEEKLEINGNEAIRKFSNYDGQPCIDVFIDYKDNKYVGIYGMFGNGSDSALIANSIKRIQESFKILK